MTLLVSIAGLAIGAVLGSLVAWAKLSGARIAGASAKAMRRCSAGCPSCSSSISSISAARRC